MRRRKGRRREKEKEKEEEEEDEKKEEAREKEKKCPRSPAVPASTQVPDSECTSPGDFPSL